MNDALRLRADAFRVVQGLQGSGDDRGDSLAAVVPARMRQAPPAVAASLGNVIPFLRPRSADVQAPDVVLPTDVARLPPGSLTRERLRHAAFVAASIVLHGSIFASFILHEPPPLASIGIEVISAELVLGATAPAGAEQTKGEQQVNAPGVDATDPQATDRQRQAEQKATEQAQSVKVGPEETAPEQTTMLERQADEPQPRDNAAAPREDRRAAEPKLAEAKPSTSERAPAQTAPEQATVLERQADEPQPRDNAAAPREDRQPADPKYSIAMVESPNTPEMATAAPKEIPPDATELSLLPQPDEKPVETPTEPVQSAPPKPAEKPTEPAQTAPPKPADKNPDPQTAKAAKAAPKPVKDARRAKERRRIDAETRQKAIKVAKASNPSVAASNVGVGRSSRDTNYKGIVWAHLARQKRSVGAVTGSATVSFTITGSGSVSGVRLSRGSGVAAIDAEVQAMVRRASPFPPPPGGRSEGFVVPVSFR